MSLLSPPFTPSFVAQNKELQSFLILTGPYVIFWSQNTEGRLFKRGLTQTAV